MNTITLITITDWTRLSEKSIEATIAHSERTPTVLMFEAEGQAPRQLYSDDGKGYYRIEKRDGQLKIYRFDLGRSV